MPRPFVIFSQLNYLIQVVHIKFKYLMTNSADSDQLEPTDLELHCLQRLGIFGFSRTRVKLKYIMQTRAQLFKANDVVS